jgi:trans-2,3-dihydro-3-hydroxyanthranilate isomerase
MAMKTPYLLYDVFTDTPFGGNPLAIFTHGDDVAPEKMQAIAREMNLSETVFLLSPLSGDTTSDNTAAHLRIFTPNGELPFAGHPTIGTIAALADNGLVPDDGRAFRLTCAAGTIICSFDKDNVTAKAIAPVLPYPAGIAPPLAEIAKATGLTSDDFITPPINDLWSSGPVFAFAEVKTTDILHAIDIDAARFTPTGCGKMVDAHLIVFCLTDFDDGIIHMRSFAPIEGIMEDPATGSAAVALSGLLHAKGLLPDGSKKISISQGEKMGRPSQIILGTLIANGKLGQVSIAGSAVKMAEGNFILTN